MLVLSISIFGAMVQAGENLRAVTCLTSRAEGFGGSVCLDKMGRAVFSGMARFYRGNPGYVIHTCDENGGLVKCDNNDPNLFSGKPTCTAYWQDLTKKHYGARYAEITARLQKLNDLPK